MDLRGHLERDEDYPNHEAPKGTQGLREGLPLKQTAAGNVTWSSLHTSEKLAQKGVFSNAEGHKWGVKVTSL